MKSIYIVLVLSVSFALAESSSESLEERWNEFKSKYHKYYGSIEEESNRKTTFQNNLKMIDEHNAEYEKGKSTFTLGINDMTDMTLEEINKYKKGFKPDLSNIDSTVAIHKVNPNITLPDHIDWREKGVVTAVKDQKLCGSCWAFSVTGVVEGMEALKTKSNAVPLSEQQLLDCPPEGSGMQDCHGGLPRKALQYIADGHPLDTENSYPYEAKKGECRDKKGKRGAAITGYKAVEVSEEALKSAVATVGPVSVAIDATLKFHGYTGGIYHDNSCDSTALNHAVLVVGYGTEQGEDYWLVKNSWGTNWGEKGYIRMKRNNKNMCGIATYASYPV